MQLSWKILPWLKMKKSGNWIKLSSISLLRFLIRSSAFIPSSLIIDLFFRVLFVERFRRDALRLVGFVDIE
jgi:hypothetical protein